MKKEKELYLNSPKWLFRKKKEYKTKKAELSHQKSSVRSHQIKIKDSSVRRTLNKKMKNIKSQERKLEEKPMTERPEVEDIMNLSFEVDKLQNSKQVLDFYLPELKIG
ncbi:MAG: hypothetical protein LRY26_00860 [Bacilli bacterium]|nr:hypothetical protein [Bacilli bacterium]